MRQATLDEYENDDMTVIEERGVTRASDYDARWDILHLPGEDGAALCGHTPDEGPLRFYGSRESSFSTITISRAVWEGGQYSHRTAPYEGRWSSHPHGQSRCSRCVALAEAAQE